MSDDAQRILLFGGSFDPAHRAHVTLAVRAADAARCDRIVFIPAAQSPLKLGPPVTPPEHRLAMLAIAIREEPKARISTIELERGGVSYFIETLDSIRAHVGPTTELCFLVGGDQALHFPRWREWKRVLELARPVVLVRPPWSTETLAAALEDVHGRDDARQWIDAIVVAPRLDFSSTVLRHRLATGDPPGDGLDPRVAAYISDHGLYRE